MGRMYIEGFKKMGVKGDELLRIHLQGNHFPPVDPSFIPACKKAIEAAKEESWNKLVELPNGRIKTAGEIIEGLHLETFLEE